MITMTRLAVAGLSMATVCLAFATLPASAAQAALTPIGVWATEGAMSHIKIEDCGGKLCGRIVWLSEPLDKEGRDKVDSENSDPSLRARKIVGLKLLTGFVPDKSAANVWRDGEIYNPDDGKTYSCNLTVKDAGTMRVRGYVGLSIFGKTQVWTRIE